MAMGHFELEPSIERLFWRRDSTYDNPSDVRKFIEARDTENTPVGSRLFAVWRFVPTMLAAYGIAVPVRKHAELGTYDGYQIPAIMQWADEIDTVDNDMTYHGIVLNRPGIAQLRNQRRLRLYFGDATNLRGIFTDNRFDTVAAVEIFGTHKDQVGDRVTSDEVTETISKITSEAHRVLRPGGAFFFTVLNEKRLVHTAEEGFGSSRGFSVSQETMTDIVYKEFGTKPTYYGQNVFECNSDHRWVAPHGFDPDQPITDPDFWTPKLITDINNQSPQYWIGIVQKTGREELSFGGSL